MDTIIRTKILVILLLITLAGCGDSKVPAQRLTQLESFCADQQGVAKSPDTAAVAQANNGFTLALYSQIDQGSGNLLISGYSVDEALSMVHVGAKNNTAAQIAAALEIPTSITNYDSAEASLTNQVVCGGIKDGYAIDVANGAWAQQGFDILPSFTGTLTSDYAAQFATLDFMGQNAAALQTINQWTSNQTNGLIPTIFNSIDPNTKLALVNALYFKGSWDSPFLASSTAPATFYVNGVTPTSVNMMNQSSEFGYASMPGYEVVEIPYTSNGYAMDVFLPNAVNGLSTVESGITADTTASWATQLQATQIALSLPKFQFATDLSLITPLIALGVVDAFSGNADFSGIDGATDLSISQAEHKTFIAVDETGTTAAAATGLGISGAAFIPSIPFNANHPFLFLIRDLGTGTTVFMGRVVDPTAH